MKKNVTIGVIAVILVMTLFCLTGKERVITVEDINSTIIHYGKDNDAHFFVVYNDKKVMEEMNFATYLKLNVLLKTHNKGIIILRKRTRFSTYNHVHIVTEDVENLYH